MVHCLGRHDVETHTEGENCIMGGFNVLTADVFYESVLNGTAEPFCQSCLQDIRENYSDAFIEGNQ